MRLGLRVRDLFAEPYGRPLRYQAVHQLVRRLRARTGIWFTPHMLRHSRATDLLRHGVGVGVKYVRPSS